jgi:hypothetical protein
MRNVNRPSDSWPLAFLASKAKTVAKRDALSDPETLVYYANTKGPQEY